MVHRSTQQKKILAYQLDFYLPEHKIVLEIDGELYHNFYVQEKDKIRDLDVQNILGSDWLIVKLSDYVINRDALFLKELFWKLRETVTIAPHDNNYDAEYMQVYSEKEMERFRN